MEENYKYHTVTHRLCKRCNEPLEEGAHGNRKSHPDCASKLKKQHQKEKYKIGNSAKLMIQKNEAIAADLYKMDHQKHGIPLLQASEFGLKFSCHTITIKHLKKDIHMFFQYGYSIETFNGENLIFIHHESDFQ
ncbi:MAG TPA: hypothetical protein VMV47_19385 [Bacteroidales bacterium]|nr:hypothetical protein [Bacteroidales bacterium]